MRGRERPAAAPLRGEVLVEVRLVPGLEGVDARQRAAGPRGVGEASRSSAARAPRRSPRAPAGRASSCRSRRSPGRPGALGPARRAGERGEHAQPARGRVDDRRVGAREVVRRVGGVARVGRASVPAHPADVDAQDVRAGVRGALQPRPALGASAVKTPSRKPIASGARGLARRRARRARAATAASSEMASAPHERASGRRAAAQHDERDDAEQAGEQDHGQHEAHAAAAVAAGRGVEDRADRRAALARRRCRSLCAGFAAAGGAVASTASASALPSGPSASSCARSAAVSTLAAVAPGWRGRWLPVAPGTVSRYSSIAELPGGAFVCGSWAVAAAGSGEQHERDERGQQRGSYEQSTRRGPRALTAGRLPAAAREHVRAPCAAGS